jgi:hypothetical protein
MCDDQLRATCNARGMSCRASNGSFLPRRTLLEKLRQ